MSLRSALYEYLTSVSAITDIASTRISPAGSYDDTPTYPFIRYQRIDTRHERHLTGGVGKRRERWQIDCYGTDTIVLDNLAEAVREALDNKTGSIGGDNAVTIKVAYLEEMADSNEPDNEGGTGHVFRVRMDFIIWYSETTTP